MDAWPQALDAVLVDTRWPHGARAALERARSDGVVSVVDADNPDPEDASLLAAADKVAFSADGLRRFTGDNDIESALRRAARDLSRWSCATRGANGVIAATPDGEIAFDLPSFPVAAIDTLAAGDIWHGAFALALGEGRSDIEAAQFANAAAAVKVTRRGGRNGAPTRAELDDFLTASKQKEPAACR
ncbi:MAG: PfkB family carbohydrate kinase, partial [Pseudomonadota bacterium]